MDLITKMAPEGWKFCSADFSIQAENSSNESLEGCVYLMRNPKGQLDWYDRLKTAATAKGVDVLDLDEENREYPLFISGQGLTLEAALADAWNKAIALKPIKEK